MRKYHTEILEQIINSVLRFGIADIDSDYLQTQCSKSKAIIYTLVSQNSDITEIIKQTIKECLKYISFSQLRENNLFNDENSLLDNLDDFL